MKKIIAIHMSNDRSGNTLVFRQSLEALADCAMPVHLITTHEKHIQGFLTDIPGIHYHYINYTERGSKWRVLFSFLLAQLLIFRKVIRLYKPEDKVYINTLLPFGAAWASRLKRAPVIYHIHETAVQPDILRSFLTKTAARSATQVVFASRFVQSKFHFPLSVKHVIHSCLPQSFVHEAIIHANYGTRKTMLMIAPLEKESGLTELLELAAIMPQTPFELVLNATNQEIEKYFSAYHVPCNVKLFDTQLNIHPFYQRAAVVLNLSQIDHSREIFDQSILEAMSYGRPVIVPAAGSANEMVAHGWNGYRVSGHHTEQVRNHLLQLLSNKPLYADMSCAAQLVASQFRSLHFKQQVAAIFQEITYTSKQQQQHHTVLLYPNALQDYINESVN